MPFERLIKAYLAERRRQGLAPVTLELTARWLGVFARFCREHRLESPVFLTPQHVEDYHNRLLWQVREGGGFLSPNTVDQALRMMRAFLRWAVGQGWLMHDPTRELVLSRPIQPRQRVLTRDQVRELLDGPDPDTPIGLRNRAILALFYFVPASKSQAAALDLADLELPGALRLPGEDQLHPLDGDLAKRLERWLQSGRPKLARDPAALFVGRLGARMGAGTFQAILQLAGAGVCPRTLRRSHEAHVRELQSRRASLS